MSKKDRITEDLPDLLEPVVDAAAKKYLKGFFGEIIDEVPVLKWVSVANKTFKAGKSYWRYKKLKAFLRLFEEETYDFSDFEKLSEEEKMDLRALIISELDAQTTEKQAEALSFLLFAYLKGKMHKLIFDAVAHEIKNTNPIVFNFNVEGYKLAKSNAGIQIFGRTEYLPAAFTTNSTESLSFTSQLYLSKIGEAFFEHVHIPMSKKHSL